MGLKSKNIIDMGKILRDPKNKQKKRCKKVKKNHAELKCPKFKKNWYILSLIKAYQHNSHLDI